MSQYSYRVTGARGAVYETTTLAEAKRMAGKRGKIERLTVASQECPGCGGWGHDGTCGWCGGSGKIPSRGKTRNPLDQRIRGVLKQYGPLVAFYTLDMLIPRRRNALPSYIRQTPVWTAEGGGETTYVDGREMLKRDMLELRDSADEPWEDSLRRYVEEALAGAEWYDYAGAHARPAMRGREYDRIVPWIALQVNRTLKGKIPLRRYGANQPHNPLEPLERMHRKLTEIRDWARATHPNIMALSLNQVLHRVGRWHTEMVRKQDAEAALKQAGKVVHRFADGWTVNKLTSRAALEAEGKTMAHCIKGYGDAVMEGRTEVYSIRDPEGRPKVTIDVNPLYGTVGQIKLKANRTIQNDDAMCARVWEASKALDWDVFDPSSDFDDGTLDFAGCESWVREQEFPEAAQHAAQDAEDAR